MDWKVLPHSSHSLRLLHNCATSVGSRAWCRQLDRQAGRQTACKKDKVQWATSSTETYMQLGDAHVRGLCERCHKFVKGFSLLLVLWHGQVLKQPRQVWLEELKSNLACKHKALTSTTNCHAEHVPLPNHVVLRSMLSAEHKNQYSSAWEDDSVVLC